MQDIKFQGPLDKALGNTVPMKSPLKMGTMTQLGGLDPSFFECLVTSVPETKTQKTHAAKELASVPDPRPKIHKEKEASLASPVQESVKETKQTSGADMPLSSESSFEAASARTPNSSEILSPVKAQESSSAIKEEDFFSFSEEILLEPKVEAIPLIASLSSPLLDIQREPVRPVAADKNKPVLEPLKVSPMPFEIQNQEVLETQSMQRPIQRPEGGPVLISLETQETLNFNPITFLSGKQAAQQNALRSSAQLPESVGQGIHSPEGETVSALIGKQMVLPQVGVREMPAQSFVVPELRTQFFREGDGQSFSFGSGLLSPQDAFSKAEALQGTQPSRQLMAMLAEQTKNGVKSFSFRLDPGGQNVQVDLSFDEGAVRARLTADDVDVMRFLQRDGDQLKQTLEALHPGLTAQLDFSFNQSQTSDSQNQKSFEASQSGKEDGGDGTSFMEEQLSSSSVNEPRRDIHLNPDYLGLYQSLV